MMTYYDYLLNEQKSPWWSRAISGSIQFLISLIASPDSTIDNSHLDPFQLTKEQKSIADLVEQKVSCDVDAKTLVITIGVTDQDPLICATVADSVKAHLQQAITNYRTQKARVDLEYNQKLYKETKARYEKARRDYAAFADANQDVILESVRSKRADLENEMQIQYNAYTQVAAQLTAASARVQEETPAFTTIQRATVPVKKAGPARAKKLLIFLFLAFLGTTVWAFHKEGDLKPLLGL
jgi:capsule polysaccharide export protein KpsE/RkpR